MPKITYIEIRGGERTVDVPVGWSVMEGAVKNRVPGIDADCGGACACATCHVYVDPEWLAKLPPRQEMEEQMLDFAQDVKSNSRLVVPDQGDAGAGRAGRADTKDAALSLLTLDSSYRAADFGSSRDPGVRTRMVDPGINRRM